MTLCSSTEHENGVDLPNLTPIQPSPVEGEGYDSAPPRSSTPSPFPLPRGEGEGKIFSLSIGE